MAEQVTFRGTRRELREALAAIPAILAGTAPDPHGVALGIQMRVGAALLTQVRLAFQEKMKGGTGNDGIKWEPLKRETIAGRRFSRAEAKAAGTRTSRKTGKGYGARGSLSAAQDKRWRQIYGSRLAKLRFHMGEGEARAKAAQIAWAILKQEGAKTFLEAFGDRQVDILRDTGELLASLSPGVDGRIPEGQIFETPPGRVIVGSNKKTWHHTGIKGRLPARPWWPPDGTIPEAWWPHIRSALAGGVMEAARIVARNGGP